MDMSFWQDMDKVFFLFLNSKHTPWVDIAMIYITKTWPWVPFYALLIFFIVLRYKLKSIWVLVCVAILVTFSDIASSRVIKPFFKRNRPCYEVDIQTRIHVVDGCGGQYGFVSTHASNTFAVAFFLNMIMGFSGYWPWLFAWSGLVSYSRIYLGVHYPGDIFGGIAFGFVLAWLIYLVYNEAGKRFFYFKKIGIHNGA